MPAKRPPPPSDEDSGSTIAENQTPVSDEDMINTGQRKLNAPDEAPANDGATAFVRLDAVPPEPTIPTPSAPSEDAPGATAFVRLEDVPSKGPAGPPPARISRLGEKQQQ